MEWQAVVALLAVAAMAGWVDAVVGGGGLLQLPALLVTAGSYPVASVLGTNKLAATLGTFTAAMVYRRKHPISRKVALVGGGAAVTGSAGGALVATAVSSDFLRPVILALLIGVAAFVLMRPQFGTSSPADPAAPDAYRDAPERRHVARLVLLTGAGIGFYDGLVGPGTGTFLIISFTTLLSLEFIQALSTVKMINVGTNLGALLVFAVQGHVLWALGLGMSVFNVAGALVGARMTLSRGSGFVRGVLLFVVAAMVIRLGYDEFA
ncbi:TSUP family transporter [Streptomyces huiliensis]|uniref:TSUP family transporter n=1 Tax=Streptomyces huiliensis TaxID=2876027 RepID=UPI001CBD041B|nr:TSUP family transporter [Streptomyces huiliensis]MBZ4318307.1 TSUP family transporter [Streptomyces huiliensis]